MQVSKGMVIIRVEDVIGFEILGNTIENVENLSFEPFGTTFGICTDYHAGASVENLMEQQAANIRAISVAAVSGFDENSARSSKIEANTVKGFNSDYANVIIGIDVQVCMESKRIYIPCMCSHILPFALRVLTFHPIP